MTSLIDETGALRRPISFLLLVLLLPERDLIIPEILSVIRDMQPYGAGTVGELGVELGLLDFLQHFPKEDQLVG
jgi:hypothetical protein